MTFTKEEVKSFIIERLLKHKYENLEEKITDLNYLDRIETLRYINVFTKEESDFVLMPTSLRKIYTPEERKKMFFEVYAVMNLPDNLEELDYTL